MNGGASSKELNESSLNISGQPENDSNIQNITSLSGAEADPNIQNQDGKTLSYCLDLDKELSDILDQLESDRSLLDNYAERISFLLQTGANRDTPNRYKNTLSYYLDKRLSDILESNRAPLNNIRHIMYFLGAEANPNIQNRYVKTLAYYSNEELFNILNELESDRSLLDNYVQHISLLLQAGADPNIQNQDRKTLLHYVAEYNDISGIEFLLGKGANLNVQDNSGKTPLHYAAENNCLQAIKFLLQKRADQNVKDQSGKIPSEYATEDECRQALKGSSHSSDDSHENKGNSITPDGSVDESNDCSNSSGDDSRVKPTELSNCNTEEDHGYGSDGSRKNEENLATPDGSVDDCSNSSGDDSRVKPTELSNCNTEEDHSYGSDGSRKNEENLATPDGSVDDCSNNSDNGTQVKSVKLSNCNTEEDSDYYSEDEDSSCSSNGYFFLEDSLLAKLEIPLTTDEQNLIGKFCKKIENTITENKQKPEESILKSIEETVNNHLNTGARLNSLCCNECKSTVTNLILEKIGDVLDDRVKPRDETREYRGGVNDITNQDDEDKDEALDIIGSIIRNLLLKGGKAKEEFFYTDTELANNCGFDYANLSKECVEIKNKLISIAYEGIVNKNEHAQKGEPEEVDIDNIYFYIKYPQDSIIEPVKIFNKAEDLKDKALNLKVGILKIGKSEVRVKSVDGKRNYTDISGSIEMSFTTKAGEISIYLHREKDSNKIEVEIDDESKAKLNKLKAEKKSLGENCFLGGKSVLEAIEDKGFEKNGSVSTETTKDDLSTNLTQVRLQQNKEVALGG